MASKFLHTPVIRTSKSTHILNQTSSTLSLTYSFTTTHHQHHLLIIPKCTLSMSSPSKPPTTKEEAILQAKTSLLYTLEKPLNNPRLTGKLKKIRQPRFRVEIPVIDDSPSSLSQLALQVFGEMPLRRKGSKTKILLLWASRDLTQAAIEVFDSRSSDILIQHIDTSSVLDEDIRTVSSADVAVFLAPEASQLEIMKTVSDSLYPRPVVIFNPKWAFEEEMDFGEMSEFVGSFDVVYSFTGLEVRGILSKRKGVIFKCVKNGVLSGENWNIYVEEGEGDLRVVSRFKARPSISEVENVLYNLMAINSPVTKSAKFLKDLVSNVTGKK
ncbi:hypothetical protein CASFOL_014894 [Castilleja foliolosa]|uniref:DUF1995 domain-containing protein n=1 Tax=Castilleja foliolosa TaxID=1961234 RepID=A0ABD3DG65_9LAMI